MQAIQTSVLQYIVEDSVNLLEEEEYVWSAYMSECAHIQRHTRVRTKTDVDQSAPNLQRKLHS